MPVLNANGKNRLLRFCIIRATCTTARAVNAINEIAKACRHMYVYVYIYIHMYYVCICVCQCIHCMHIHIYVHMHIYTGVYVYIYTYIITHYIYNKIKPSA